jgi:hypothetical protein
VDVVESHPDRLVVDVTCNARDTDHAEQLAKAVDRWGSPGPPSSLRRRTEGKEVEGIRAAGTVTPTASPAQRRH